MDKSLRYFLMVAIENNIKQAAEKLHISQPSLTTAIKKLEHELGVELFIRRSKGVELSAYGKLFREYVQEQQEKQQQLLHQFTDMQQRHQGKLKLGTGEAWWELFVRDTVCLYQKNTPNCSIHLEFGNNLSLIHHLVQGDIDLFIGHEIQDLHERCKVHFQPLFRDQEAFFVCSSHPILNTKKSDDELLIEQAQYPLIRVTPDHSRHRTMLTEHASLAKQYTEQRESKRAIYDVDSLFASIDILEMANAIMPYSDKMCHWMARRNIATLTINKKKKGNVGIYIKQGIANPKITSFIEILTKYTSSL